MDLRHQALAGDGTFERSLGAQVALAELSSVGRITILEYRVATGQRPHRAERPPAHALIAGRAVAIDRAAAVAHEVVELTILGLHVAYEVQAPARAFEGALVARGRIEIEIDDRCAGHVV